MSEVCRCCAQPYKRGDWNFYNLCDPCFANFDRRKMRARFAFAKQWLREEKPEPIEDYEDVDLFIKYGRCSHSQ